MPRGLNKFISSSECNAKKKTRLDMLAYTCITNTEVILAYTAKECLKKKHSLGNNGPHLPSGKKGLILARLDLGPGSALRDYFTFFGRRDLVSIIRKLVNLFTFEHKVLRKGVRTKQRENARRAHILVR